jgi:TRAP-type C4-dicarboxylate transport system permease large subunit
MAETIPPSIPLIILGFVANISIGGLFVAGLVPAALMMAAIIIMAIVFGSKAPVVAIGADQSTGSLVGGGLVVLGLLVVIFGGDRSGLATATEASAFAALYALVVGALLSASSTCAARSRCSGPRPCAPA